MEIENLSSQIDQNCRFCNPPEKNRILFESEHFYVMLSLGPIVEGYMLLVSKNHYECCAALPENFSYEFDELYQAIKSLLKEHYGHVIAYEHGRAGSCLIDSESKHCYHAHMHFVPVNFEMNNEVSLTFSGEELENLTGFRQYYLNGKKSYLFVEDVEKAKIYFPSTEVKRQYLRTLVANNIAKPESWDWLTYQNWPLIESGIKNLRPLFDALKSK